jgi:hypothetical protein
MVDNYDNEPDSISDSGPKVDEESGEECEEDVTQPIKYTPKRVLLPPTRVLNDNPGFSFKSQSRDSEEESIEENDN